MISLAAALLLTQTYPVLQNVNVTANGSKPVTGLTSGELDLIVNVSGRVDGGAAALSFLVQESDPLAPNTVLDGGVSFGVGPVTASVALGPTHAKLFNSSSVLVSWTVDGGSYFGGVNASIINRTAVSAPSVEGIDGGRPVQIAGTVSVAGAGGVTYGFVFVDGGTVQSQQGGLWDVFVDGGWVGITQMPYMYGSVFVDGGSVGVTAIPYIYGSVFIDGGTVQSQQNGNWSVQAVVDGGLTIVAEPYQYASVFVDGGNVGISNLPSILPDGGSVQSYQGGTWFMNFGDGGTVPVYVLNPSAGPLAFQPISIASDGGNASVVITGQVGNVSVDPAQHTSCTATNVLVGLSSTAAPGSVLANRTSAQWYNGGNNPVWWSPIAGVSTPDAIDAGCVVGSMLQPGAYLNKSESLPIYFVADVAQTSPDAGLIVTECK